MSHPQPATNKGSSEDGKCERSTFNEKIEIAKVSHKVDLCDFFLYFVQKTDHFFVNHATLADPADVHFGTFDKCDYLG